MASTETTLNQPHLSKQDLSTLVRNTAVKMQIRRRGFFSPRFHQPFVNYAHWLVQHQ